MQRLPELPLLCLNLADSLLQALDGVGLRIQPLVVPGYGLGLPVQPLLGGFLHCLQADWNSVWLRAPFGALATFAHSLVMAAATYGSALTYSRRYGLAAMLGILTEDDDGNAASNTQKRAHLRDRPKMAL